MPFGEEIIGLGNRTSQQGYSVNDNVRQKFTQYERDTETGLDYAQARYYGSSLGRFTTVDPLMASAKTPLPQSWNRYIYCYNNPLRFIDPDGMDVQILDDKARDLLIKTLPNDIREQVEAAVDKNGRLIKGSLDKIKSKDANFLALRGMVNHKKVTEVATSATGDNGVAFFERTNAQQREMDIQNYMQNNPNVTRQQAEQLITLNGDGWDVLGYYGQTYTPNGEGGTPKSPSGNLRAVATDQTGEGATISEEDAVVAMGHELYNHTYKFRIGDRTWKAESGPGVRAIEERTRENYRSGPRKDNSVNVKPRHY
jgi:RHS repeat-associated protein